MEEPSEWLPALGAFARRRTDVRLFHLFDREEWTLGFKDAAVFYSPEGGAELAVDPMGARAAFAEVVEEYVNEVRSGVVRWGGRYVPVGTDRAMEDAIRRAILDSMAEGTWA